MTFWRPLVISLRAFTILNKKNFDLFEPYFNYKEHFL